MFIEKIVLVALGALGTVLWYFIRRKIENKSTLDHIEKNERLLKLRQDLDSSGISVSELNEFEKILTGKANSALAVSEKFARQAEDAIRLGKDEQLTQLEMNEAALRTHHITEAYLERVVEELRSQLAEDEVVLFNHSQEFWTKYRESYGDFVGQLYEGGSIRPLMVLSALESITATRISELEAEVEQRKL